MYIIVVLLINQHILQKYDTEFTKIIEIKICFEVDVWNQ